MNESMAGPSGASHDMEQEGQDEHLMVENVDFINGNVRMTSTPTAATAAPESLLEVILKE